MSFTVNINQNIIDHNTENCPSIPGVTVNGKPALVPVDCVCTGTATAVKALLRASANTSGKKTRQVSYWMTKNVKGERIDFMDIACNSKTNDVFNLFKKYGVYTPKLTCGYCPKTQTMYLSAKTSRDLSRMANDTSATLAMYILSLMHFIREASEGIADISYDVYSDTINIVAADDDIMAKLFTGFPAETAVTIQASGTDDLVAIKFVKSILTAGGENAMAPGMRYAYLYDTAVEAYVGAVLPVLAGVTPYTFIVYNSKVSTDFEMCTVELREDSMCGAIAAGFPISVSVIKRDDLAPELSATLELRHCDSEEVPEDLPSWLADWTKIAIANGAQVATSADTKYLTEKYGVKVPKGYSGCDPDEIKKMYDEDAYAQELYKQAKPYYDVFELGNLNANLVGFAKGAIYAMAFVGESGTGKSTAARVIPHRCGLPYVSINFSVNIEEADLFGSMFPNPSKTKAEDPEFVWQDGIITKAVRNGYVVILEEINFARPGVLGKLNSLLDENRQLDLPNGEVLRAHPNFRIIATCNIAYEGTNRFNKALINRFDDVTVFKDLKRDEAIEVIRNRTGYTDKTKLDKVYNVYEALKKFAAEQNVNLVVSMRQLLNMFTKGKYYKDAKDAVCRIILNGAFLEDPEYQKVFEDTVLPSFDLKFKI